MATDDANELASFHHFLGQRLAASHGDLSPEEALDLWRAEHPQSVEFAESVAALREALADMEAGDTGVPIEEFDRDFRHRRNLGGNP